MNSAQTTLFFLLSLLTAQTPFNTLVGIGVEATSGDSFTLSVQGEPFKVRLVEVDAPEVKQPFFEQSRQFLRRQIVGKSLKVNYKFIDRFNRVIAQVILPTGLNLNEIMVRDGWAWHYRVETTLNEELAQLEYQAWKNKAGLWIEPKPVPPWEFRRETQLPFPPATPHDVDYDQIFSYGLTGDTRTKVYRWPECKDYKWLDPAHRKTFASKLQAEAMGYKRSRDCPGR